MELLNTSSSLAQFQRAQQVIPGGVNSPVRSFQGLHSHPIFVKRAQGVTLTDVDDNQYTDFCLSWGVHLLGHGHPQVIEDVRSALEQGTSYGMPTTIETDLAELIVKAVPSIEMVRLVSSGTEAVMSAIRLARGYTRRNIIVKFDGCYHGHADHLLVAAGSGVAQLANSSSKGIPNDFTKHTLSLEFNNEVQVREAFQQYGNEIAAIVIEPVPANMGVVLPADGFLQFLRNITIEFGSLLIFDEVITGFRPQWGGAQATFGVTPDLTTLGKIIGGGFPVGAYGGRKEIMLNVAPAGEVYQAGTLSGNPIAVTAGIQTLKLLGEVGFYDELNHKANRFIDELKQLTFASDIMVNSFGSMFTIFFSSHRLVNYEDVKKCDQKRFETFFKKLLTQKVYFSPSQFETNFISAAHSDLVLNQTLDAVKWALKSV